MCETDATEVSETADLDCELTDLVIWEDSVTYSCRLRYINKIDIKVLFGGWNDWATGWTVRPRIPVCVRDFLQNVETSSGTHPASHAMGTGIFSREKNSRSWC